MNNEKSTATGKSDAAIKEEKTSVRSKDVLSGEEINFEMVQNILLIWLDDNIDEKSVDFRNTIAQLRWVVNTINLFTDVDQCIDFLKSIHRENVCMVISDTLCETVVPLIHAVAQLHTIFIFCVNKTIYEPRTEEWFKIKGVFTEVSSICKALKQVARQCEQNAIPISFINTSGDMSKKSFDQLDPTFMYTQILKEILLTIKYDQNHVKEFIDHCQQLFVGNDRQLNSIRDFEAKYHDKTPIWWYTYEIFLYTMLNRALRLMDVDIIIKMGFFMNDVHHHIEQLHKEQFVEHHSDNTFTVYRGQVMSKEDFDQMVNTKGGLISFNNLLSTSKDPNVSLLFAESNPSNTHAVGIQFVIQIDPSKSSAPFASINLISHFQDENEVLFSMNTVFRIVDIKPIDGNPSLFQVDLTLISDNDTDLTALTNRIRQETSPDVEGWYRLGLLLFNLEKPDKAHQIYELLLKQTTNEVEKASIYRQLGRAKRRIMKYQEAIIFYEKAIDIYRNNLSSDHFDLAVCFHNIGAVYYDMGDYSQALSFYEKALEIREQLVPPNYPYLAGTYNNMGMVYNTMREYSKALSFYEKALEIRKKSLPLNHPDLAMSFNNIASVYDDIREYSKALLFHEKALEIRKQSLPPNHSGLIMSYNNIGSVYYNMGEYSKALSVYEKTLEMRKQSLPPNHSDFAISYNNIAYTYYNMGEYSKALVFYEKTLEIRKQTLPLNHPDLTGSYNNIGSVYYNMGEYSKALAFYENTLEIRKQSLPLNHSDFAGSYNNIGSVYYSLGEYSKALIFYEKALAIREQSLAPNHPDLAMCYTNIGSVYYSLGEYSKALSFHEKALEIYGKSLPAIHPDWAMCFNNIGLVYDHTGEHSKALSFYEKALEIYEKTLPGNHRSFGSCYNSIGMVYAHMDDISKACFYYQRAVENGQDSLPSNHPTLEEWRSNLENIKKKL